MNLIKSASEIQKIQQAQSHIDEILTKQIPSWLREGVTEKEIAQKLEKTIRADGKFELAFPLIVAFGEGAAEPHHIPSQRELRLHDAILIDCGAKYDGWCSDCTRMFCLGEPTTEFREKYEKVLRIHEEALLRFRAGTEGSQIDRFVRDRLGEDEIYFIHSLGHGIGKEVHEDPKIMSQKTRSKSKDQSSQRPVLNLQEGMVLTCEPGVYYPRKFGIRIEDIFVVRKDGPEILSQACKDLLIL